MKKGDKFIIFMVIVVFIMSIFSMIYYFSKQNSNEKLIGQVYKKGKLLYSFNLNEIVEPKEVKIEGYHGEYNIVLVEKNRIRFKESNCKDEVCVKTLWLSRKGEMAVCLPHKVYIKIVGEDENIDGATF